MILVVIALLAGGVPLAFAEDSEEALPNRPSAVSLVLSRAKNDFSTTNLLGRFGLSESWLLSVGMNSSRSQGELTFQEISGGADVRLSETIDFHFGALLRSEITEVKGAGALIGLDWNLGSLERATWLRLEGGGVGYRHPQASARGFLERFFRIGLEQELSNQISAGITLTTHRYGASARALNQTFRNRRVAYSGIEGVVVGFPEDSLTLDLGWQATPTFFAGLSASTSSAALDDTRTRALGLSLSQAWTESWMTTVDATSLQYGAEQSAGQLGLGITYSW